MAHAPHYALFFHKKEVGSMHDFKLHSYSEYTLKTANEHTAVPEPHHQWAVLRDSAYQGAAEETLTICRISILPNAITTQDACTNTELANICVPVEQFFSCMQIL